ncbi:hypothetical protein Tco_0279692 [Tanacetum coccineum]
MLLCCVPDMAYGPYPIRRISNKSALAVEIDLTWSLGLVFVELGRLSNPLSCKTLLVCPISDSAINLVSDQDTKSFHCSVGRILTLLLYTVLQVDRVHQTVCSKLLLEFSFLPLVDNPSYSAVPCIVRIRPDQRILSHLLF